MKLYPYQIPNFLCNDATAVFNKYAEAKQLEGIDLFKNREHRKPMKC